MSADFKTTTHYAIPLAWDKYTTDRELVEEAFERIDAALNSIADSSANNADNVEFEKPDGSTESVSDALTNLYSTIGSFEIAAVATSGADAGETLWAYAASRPFNLPFNLDGTKTTVQQLTSPVDLVINVLKNGGTIGTITIVSNIAVYDLPSQSLFEVGDTLSLVATSNVSFQTIAITLFATRLD